MSDSKLDFANAYYKVAADLKQRADEFMIMANNLNAVADHYSEHSGQQSSNLEKNIADQSRSK